MSKHHGELAPLGGKSSKPPEVLIPQVLRNRVLMFNKHTPEEEKTIYGVWRVRALKELPGNNGEVIKPGDTFSLAGNQAALMAYDRDVEFCDERLAKERELAAELEKITKQKVRVGDMPEFQQAAQQAEAKPKWRD